MRGATILNQKNAAKKIPVKLTIKIRAHFCGLRPQTALSAPIALAAKDTRSFVWYPTGLAPLFCNGVPDRAKMRPKKNY
jgi:hypothetical protein